DRAMSPARAANHVGARVDAGVPRAAGGDPRRQHALPGPDLQHGFPRFELEELQRRRHDERLVVAAALVADPAVVPRGHPVPARVAGRGARPRSVWARAGGARRSGPAGIGWHQAVIVAARDRGGFGTMSSVLTLRPVTRYTRPPCGAIER